MTRLRKRGGRSRGATLLGLFLAATVGLGGWLGYQAVVTAASHERAVDAALTDYAEISAWELAGAVRSEVDELLREAFGPVRRRMRGRLPDPEVVGWELSEAAHDEGCRCEAFHTPLALFRIEAATGGFVVEPDTLAETTRRAIAQLVLGQDLGRRVDAVVTSPAGAIFEGAVAVGFMVSRDDGGRGRGDRGGAAGRAPGEPRGDVLFGFVVPAHALGEFVAEVYEDRDLLPEPLADGRDNDALLHVRVRDAAGVVLFQAPRDEPDRWVASRALGPDFGTLVVDATVRPDAAGLLIIGGVPRSRVPMLALLLALTLGVGGLALVQLRRERAFQTLRDDFVSGVSHELRTPLAQIQMFAELQQAEKLGTEADRRRAVEAIHRESRRLGHLVENILQFSRLQRTPDLAAPTEDVDLAAGLADGIDAVRPLLRARGMHLEVASEPGLHVRAHRDALTRVVVNLLDNAAKFGPDGQTVRLIVARENGSARVTVSDNGPGVPPTLRKRVWEPYRRLERDVEATTPGTGIGLSLVADLVHLHGARVWVEDEAGGGARFVVELPLSQTDAAEGTAAGTAAGASDEGRAT